MTNPTPIERAKDLFFRRNCTCGGIDIGVGVMHEPTCGLPTPDDVADAIDAAVLVERMQQQKPAAEALDCWEMLAIYIPPEAPLVRVAERLGVLLRAMSGPDDLETLRSSERD